MGLARQWSFGREWAQDGLQVVIQFRPNSWSLPVSFGGGVWADEEIGDYGTVYSCEYFAEFIVGVLCFWFRFSWPTERGGR